MHANQGEHSPYKKEHYQNIDCKEKQEAHFHENESIVIHNDEFAKQHSEQESPQMKQGGLYQKNDKPKTNIEEKQPKNARQSELEPKECPQFSIEKVLINNTTNEQEQKSNQKSDYKHAETVNHFQLGQKQATNEESKQHKKAKIVDTGQCFQSEAYVHPLNRWEKQLINITSQSFSVGLRQVQVDNIRKLKVLPDAVVNGAWKIKITIGNNEVYFCPAVYKITPNGYCLHYRWFAEIIIRKLQIMGIDTNATTKHKDQEKVAQLPINGVAAKGMLYKLSKFKKNWQSRLVALTKDQLYSYKSAIEPHSFSIKGNSIRYLWTRFELYKEMLVIKLKHSLGKTELAIPICDFRMPIKSNWLLHLYRLAMEWRGAVLNQHTLY